MKIYYLINPLFFVTNVNNNFNGIDTEILNSVFNGMKNQPKIAKATFL